MSPSSTRPGGAISAPEPAQRYASALQALNRGDWRQAQILSMPLLREAPQHAGVHFVAGVAALEMQQAPLAIQCLHRAAILNPQRADYMAHWSRALAAMRMPGEAVQVADRALALSPQDALTFDALGVVYTQANAHEKAVEVFRRAAALAPAIARYRFNLGTSLTYSGELDAAERELEACLAINPKYWKAYLPLVQLRRQTEAANHVERMQALLPQVADDATGQLHLNLALAKEYEDLADYPRSFTHLSRGKSVGRAGREQSVKRNEPLFAALTESFLAPQLATSGLRTTEPIFVLGMPRSGTTLVERIISSHPAVHSAGELQNFSIALKRLSGSTTSSLFDIETIERARNVDWNALGAKYLASTRPLTGHTPRFIDKLPHNFLYAGYIAKALPDAKIICLRRSPMDTCLSNFRQLFAPGTPYYDYSFDLLDTGRYYVLFDRLMAHWQTVFPGRILEIDYETIVDAQEDSSRRLLEFCDLPWDEACLRFEDNQAPVSTASAVQVRSPIYRSALKRWKHYEAQMAELKALLTDAGIALDD